jgi:hypothetical protein
VQNSEHHPLSDPFSDPKQERIFSEAITSPKYEFDEFEQNSSNLEDPPAQHHQIIENPHNKQFTFKGFKPPSPKVKTGGDAEVEDKEDNYEEDEEDYL